MITHESENMIGPTHTSQHTLDLGPFDLFIDLYHNVFVCVYIYIMRNCINIIYEI